MVYTEHDYVERGYQSAKAMTLGHAKRAQALIYWLNQAKALESAENRSMAQHLWDRGKAEYRQK